MQYDRRYEYTGQTEDGMSNYDEIVTPREEATFDELEDARLARELEDERRAEEVNREARAAYAATDATHGPAAMKAFMAKHLVQPETPKLTPKQRAMIEKIATSEFRDDGPLTSPIWTNTICDTRSGAAVYGSLLRKGLVNGMGGFDDATCWLTDAGVAAYYELHPELKGGA